MERCCWLLKNLSKLGDSECPRQIHGESFRDMVEAAEITGLTKEQRLNYEKSMLDEININGVNEDYHNQGVAEGFAKGLAEGEARGEANKSREIAVNLKKAGVRVDTIALATGLSEEEISNL